MNKYIVDGKVARDKIAMDIRYRRITRTDLERLVADPVIQAAFIGTTYEGKKSQSEWNETYLDLVSYAVVAMSFNSDYLLYLDAVAEHVAKAAQHAKQQKRNKFAMMLIAGAMILVISIILIVVKQ